MKKLQKDQPQKATAPKRGRRLCDKRGSERITERQLQGEWPIELGEAAQAVVDLNLDMTVTGLNGGGKPVNFLGHEVGSKSAAVDKCIVTAATTGSFDTFIEALSNELVTTGRRHDAKALKSKLYAHDRHYAGNGSVSFQACCEHVGLGKQYATIQPAMSRLLSLTRKTL